MKKAKNLVEFIVKYKSNSSNKTKKYVGYVIKSSEICKLY